MKNPRDVKERAALEVAFAREVRSQKLADAFKLAPGVATEFDGIGKLFLVTLSFEFAQEGD